MSTACAIPRVAPDNEGVMSPQCTGSVPHQFRGVPLGREAPVWVPQRHGAHLRVQAALLPHHLRPAGCASVSRPCTAPPQSMFLLHSTADELLAQKSGTGRRPPSDNLSSPATVVPCDSDGGARLQALCTGVHCSPAACQTGLVRGGAPAYQTPQPYMCLRPAQGPRQGWHCRHGEGTPCPMHTLQYT